MRENLLFTLCRSARSLAVAATLLASTLGAASARDLDPTLVQYVIASCSQDAYRLCPQSLSSEKDAVSCMKAKHSQLNGICRTAYDKVARVLAQ